MRHEQDDERMDLTDVLTIAGGVAVFTLVLIFAASGNKEPRKKTKAELEARLKYLVEHEKYEKAHEVFLEIKQAYPDSSSTL